MVRSISSAESPPWIKQMHCYYVEWILWQNNNTQIVTYTDDSLNLFIEPRQKTESSLSRTSWPPLGKGGLCVTPPYVGKEPEELDVLWDFMMTLPGIQVSQNYWDQRGKWGHNFGSRFLSLTWNMLFVVSVTQLTHFWKKYCHLHSRSTKNPFLSCSEP
jgi:hypothetical protein